MHAKTGEGKKMGGELGAGNLAGGNRYGNGNRGRAGLKVGEACTGRVCKCMLVWASGGKRRQVDGGGKMCWMEGGSRKSVHTAMPYPCQSLNGSMLAPPHTHLFAPTGRIRALRLWRETNSLNSLFSCVQFSDCAFVCKGRSKKSYAIE